MLPIVGSFLLIQTGHIQDETIRLAKFCFATNCFAVCNGFKHLISHTLTLVCSHYCNCDICLVSLDINLLEWK